ncbi:MAG: rhomboid family intramembrane serine protease [Anaerolineales bacterium]|nr:rhomboid family intramembrane serine protease [Anaerolineales bacterium]
MNRPPSEPPLRGSPDLPPPAPAYMVSVRPPATRPMVTYIILGVTILVYILQQLSEVALGGDWPLIIGAKINEYIFAGQIWRLITPVMLHASILHIGFNMYALYSFGPALERHYGHWRFLALYGIGGFAGNVISFLFSLNPSVGSSTAIFGLLGAEAVFLYQNRQLFGSIATRALGQVVTIAIVNLVIGLSPGIDNWGHIGGLLGGSLFAFFAGPLFQLKGYYPDLALVDSREPRDIVVAGLGVSALFAFLTIVALLMRR